jgi:hypothetical protein
MKSYRDSAAYQRSQRRTRDGKPVWPLSFLDRPRGNTETNVGEV